MGETRYEPVLAQRNHDIHVRPRGPVGLGRGAHAAGFVMGTR
jgi:hypothetical protein